MLCRLLKLVSASMSRESASRASPHIFTAEDIFWVMGSFCTLNRKPFDVGLLQSIARRYVQHTNAKT